MKRVGSGMTVNIQPPVLANYDIEKTTRLIFNLLDELGVLGLDVKGMRYGEQSELMDVEVFEPSAETHVYARSSINMSMPAGEEMIRELTRLLELKVIERRLAHHHLNMLLVGWKIDKIDRAYTDDESAVRQNTFLVSMCHDDYSANKSYSLTYAGLGEFEEDLSEALERRKNSILVTAQDDKNTFLTTSAFCWLTHEQEISAKAPQSDISSLPSNINQSGDDTSAYKVR